MTTSVSLAQLDASGIRLRPAEAVAIVGELCRQRAARILPGLPSRGVIRLTKHGEITIEGPVPSGKDSVARAAQLLESMLPPFDAPPEYRASGALRLAIARAQGTLDLPPYASLEQFCAVLVRFSTLDPRETAASLVATWAAQAAAAPGEMAVGPAVGSPRDRRRIPAAVWVGAPAAAAALGYLLTMPFVADRQAPAPASATAAPAVTPATVEAPDARVAAQAPPTSPSPSQAKVAAHRSSEPQLLQASAYSPSFAPSGAIYFHDQHPGATALKVRRDADVEVILEDEARNFHARPSPDGSMIAFDSDREGVRAVYVARVDGTDIRRVSGEGFASVPSWSPDGRRLAFVRAEARAPKVWNLWIANLDGSGLRRVTNHRVGQAWGGSWFPDGRRIAYSVESRLVIVDLASGVSRVLESPRAGRLARTPAVSPDGERIVFQVQHDGTWITNLRTGAMRRVLDDPTAEEFTWAPDGRHIAYHSHRTGSWSVWMLAL